MLNFLDPFFARHVHQPLYRMLSKPLTYDLVHAALDTLNRESAPGHEGFRPEIYQHFHQHFVPRMNRIIQDFESTGSLPDSWSVALLNPIPKTAGIPTSVGHSDHSASAQGSHHLLDPTGAAGLCPGTQPTQPFI